MAFRGASKYGVSGFEIDLRLSKDGVIILSHDADLGRLGRPDIVIREQVAEKLDGVEIGSMDGATKAPLLTLDELFMNFSRMDFIFDCKEDGEELFLELRRLIELHVVSGRLWFLTWSATGDARVKRYFPEHHFFFRGPGKPISRDTANLSIIT